MPATCTYGLEEVPTDLLDQCHAWGRPAREQFSTKNPIRCFVGSHSVEFHYPATRTQLEFPRPKGRGDEVSYQGTQVIEFQVPHEMIPHVPEWAEKSELEKIQAACFAIFGGNRKNQGVEYRFHPEEETGRRAQWPYTSEEVACQNHILKHWD